jgi:hypothetical protein
MMSQALGHEVGFMLASLLFLQQSHWLTAEQLHYFRGPILFGQTDWSGTLPDTMVQNLVTAVRIERFWQLLNEAEGQTTSPCTPAEVVCALQPYSLCAPLPHDLAHALLWSFTQMVTWHPELFEGMGDAVGPDLHSSIPPEPYTLQELGIRRKVVARAPKHRTSEPEPPVSEASGAQYEQFSLFEV